jgi:transcriptional regulator with XRE-family HTH domain
MKERIIAIMEKENLTPTRFADRLQINRGVISHILSGRNKPSLEVVTKILEEMPYINPEWLLKGTGNMVKNGIDQIERPVEPDLFRQPAINQKEDTVEAKERQEIKLKQPENSPQNTEYKVVETQKTEVRKISQIIIYYTDNTFEIFNRLNNS